MTYEICGFDAAHREYQSSMTSYARIAEIREDWTKDKKFSLLCCKDDRQALMLNVLERLNEDEQAELVLSLIQPDQELRYMAIEQTRRRMTIEAGKVAESEAEIRQEQGLFGGAR